MVLTKATNADRLLLLLHQKGPMAPTKIAGVLGLTKSTTRGTGFTLKNKGLISSDGELYRLTEAGKREATRLFIENGNSHDVDLKLIRSRAPKQKSSQVARISNTTRRAELQPSTKLRIYAALGDVKELIKQHTLPVIEEAILIHKEYIEKHE